MIINTLGAEFECYGTKYVIGEPVIGTDESEYEGLQGIITEIRDGDDKDTDNETPDLYCSFEEPILPDDIKKLEETFSDLYGEPKKLDDINLDSVIMAPSMVRPIKDIDKDMTEHTVYVLDEDWAINDDYGHNLEIYTDFGSAKRSFTKKLKEELESGCIPQWKDDENFVEESTTEFYECFIEGFHSSDHYSLEIKKQTIKMEPAFIRETGNQYLAECKMEDFKKHLEHYIETGKISPESCELLVQDKRVPEMIDKALSKNDSYWEAYWESVSEVAREVIKEMLKEMEGGK